MTTLQKGMSGEAKAKIIAAVITAIAAVLAAVLTVVGNYALTLKKENDTLVTKSQTDTVSADQRISDLETANQTLRDTNADLQSSYDAALARIDEKDATIARQTAEIAEKNAIIGQKDEEISALKAQIDNMPDEPDLRDNTPDASEVPSETEAVNFLEVCSAYKSSYYDTPEKMIMMGKTYLNGFRLTAYSNGYAYFSLERKYSVLEFDLGLVDGYNMYGAKYDIYLDGELSETIEGTPVEVKHITLELNHASQLHIAVSSNSHSCFYGFGNVTIR